MQKLTVYLFVLLLVFIFAGCKKNPDASCSAVGKQVTYQILSITGGCPMVDFASWTNETGNVDQNDTASAGFSQAITIRIAPGGCFVDFEASSSTCEITARILVNGIEVKRGTGNDVQLDYYF